MGGFRYLVLLLGLLNPGLGLAGSSAPGKGPSPHTQLRREAARMGINLKSFDRTFAYIHQFPEQFPNKNFVTIIDYTKPSTQKRMFVFDLRRNKISALYVAHGRRTGEKESTSFSNRIDSYKSSLGFMKTGAPYHSHDVGLALVLYGLEPQNSNLYERKIVIHGAWYVSPRLIQKRGLLGRSLGCPAVERKWARWLIDRIKGGSLLYSFYETTGPA